MTFVTSWVAANTLSSRKLSKKKWRERELSEPKKPSEEIKEILQIVVKQLSELQKSQTTSTHEEPKQKLAIEHIDECPTCRNQFKEKLKPELYKEFKEKLKSKELLTCDGCGEIVEKTETECPTCHGTHAH